MCKRLKYHIQLLYNKWETSFRMKKGKRFSCSQERRKIKPKKLPRNFITSYLQKKFYYITKGGLRGGTGDARALFFATTCFFYDHFEELQTVFIEVKLIINNAPLTYAYSNTIKTYLTPNHLLSGRQLLCYSNTASTVVRNLTVLSTTTDKINCISNHFWHRWRHEYAVNLRDTQRASKLNMNSQIMLSQFMIKRCPDSFGEFPQ